MATAAPVAPSPYELHREYVLSILSRRCRWLDAADREAMLHDAYAVMLEKQRDGALDLAVMHSAQVRAYLVQTALHKALDEGKRAGRKRAVPLEHDDYVDESGLAPDERLDADIDSARMREIIAELPERQQTIVKLRFFFDRSPLEIQRYLDVTERVYRRELERAMQQISERYELVRAGTFCDSRRSVILAYVAGIAGPNRALDARRHLETCTACAHWAGELRTASEKVAAAIPLPVFVQDGMFERLRERLVDLVAGVEQHVHSLAARADPSVTHYAAAARPGTVAATVAGCLALGSGATYCVVEGLPAPVRAALGQEQRSEKPKRTTRAAPAATPERRRTVVVPSARAAAPAPTPDPAPVRREKPKRRRAAVKTPQATPQPADPAAVEFGPEGVQSGAPAPRRARPLASPFPTRRPANSTRELGGAEIPSRSREGIDKPLRADRTHHALPPP